LDTGASAVVVAANPAKSLVPVRRKPNRTSFQKGNQVARKSGLQAKTEKGTGFLQKRIGHAVNRKLREAAAMGRPIDALQLPGVRRLCQDVIMRERAYAEIMRELALGKKFGDLSEKTLDYFCRFGNNARAEEMALGWSATSRGALLRDLAGAAKDRQQAMAASALQRDYGRKQVAS
jgi:hypothetical protein